jgi:chemotaxis protein histidine kinase CheA
MTFDLRDAADIANSLESLIQARRDGKLRDAAQFFGIFEEGVTNLGKCLRSHKAGAQTESPKAFFEKLAKLGIFESNDPLSPALQLPFDLVSQLTPPEKAELRSAMRSGMRMIVLEKSIDGSRLDELKQVRAALDNDGKVIAVSAKQTSGPDALCFLIFYVSERPHPYILGITDKMGLEVVYPQKISGQKAASPLEELLIKLSASIRESAAAIGKQVDFNYTIEAGPDLKPTAMTNVSEILIQLARNAVDHGIETSEQRVLAGKDRTGHISFRVHVSDNQTLIHFEDDGRGIDTDAVRKSAAAAGISDALSMPEKAVLNELIFTHGFSTKSAPESLSGRGVGLDLVLDLVSKRGGSISVETKPGKGTSFTIEIPNSATRL